MKPNLVFLALILIPVVLASPTFRPFLRSRYSQRWQQVTGVPEIKSDTMDVSTNTADKSVTMNQASSTVSSAAFEISTNKIGSTTTFAPLKENNQFRNTMAVSTRALSSSTIHPAIKPSTVAPPDYDYYGHGEVEDAENKY